MPTIYKDVMNTIKIGNLTIRPLGFLPKEKVVVAGTANNRKARRAKQSQMRKSLKPGRIYVRHLDEIINLRG